MPKRGKDKPKGRPRTGPKIVAKVLKIGPGKRGGHGKWGRGGKASSGRPTSDPKARPTAGRPTAHEQARIKSDREHIVAGRRRLAAAIDANITTAQMIADGLLKGRADQKAVMLRAAFGLLTKAGIGDKSVVEHQSASPVFVSFGDAGGLPRPDADVDGLPPEDDPEEQG